MKTYRFRNPKPLAAAIFALTAVFSLLTLANISLDLHYCKLLEDILAHDSDAAHALVANAHIMADEQRLAIGLAGLALLVNIVLFCIWMYRAAGNIRALGARGLEFTPGWAVGYMFIPIANLVMTYRSVLEVWTTSHDLSGHTVRAGWLPVLSWWLLYLLGGIALRISKMMLGDHPHDLNGVLHAGIAEIVANSIELVAAGLFMFIVWRVSTLQNMPACQPAAEAESPLMPPEAPA